MQRYVGLNTGNRIVSTTDLEFPQEGQAAFDFPDGFDFSKQGDYKFVGGELVYDPVPKTQPEPQPDPFAELWQAMTDGEIIDIEQDLSITELEIKVLTGGV